MNDRGSSLLVMLEDGGRRRVHVTDDVARDEGGIQIVESFGTSISTYGYR